MQMEDKDIFRSIWNCYEGHDPEKGDKTAFYNGIHDPEFEYNGMPALHFAATYADAEGIRILLSKGADPEVRTESMESNALHAMAYGRSGNYDIPEGAMKEAAIVLMEAGTSPLRKNADGVTCTHIAARDAKHGIVSAVAEMKKKLDMTDNKGNTPLHLACDYACSTSDSFFKYTEPGHRAMMAKVAGYEAEERVLNIQKATSQRQYDRERKRVDDYFVTVKILIDNGLDPDQKNNRGETAKDIASKCMDIRISALVNGTYSEDGSEGSILKMRTKGMNLTQAVLGRDHDALDALLKLGDDPNRLQDALHMNGFDADGKYPLGAACAFLDAESIEMLLGSGADPNAKDAHGKIPLVYCLTASASHRIFEDRIPERIMEAMNEYGLRIDGDADENGNTMLNLACRRAGHASAYNGKTIPDRFIGLLLKMKADVNIPDNSGVTPLMHICAAGSGEDLQISLLEKGADVAAKDRNGNTPLMYAAGNPDKNAAKVLSEMLFEFGDPDVNAVNNEGKSALETATDNDNENLVKFILQKM